MKTTHYTILDVSPSAELDAVYIAHHNAVAALKNRVIMGDPEAQAQTRLLDMAYEALADPEKRAIYDTSLAAEQTQMMTPVKMEDVPTHPIRRMLLLILLLVMLGRLWQDKSAERRAQDIEAATKRGNAASQSANLPDSTAPATVAAPVKEPVPAPVPAAKKAP